MIRFSEYVSIGHPDKIADYISQYLLDRYIEQDPTTRYAVEVQIKGNSVTLGGEVSSKCQFSPDGIAAFARRAVCEIGYTQAYQDMWGKCNTICGDWLTVRSLISQQSPDIAQGTSLFDPVLAEIVMRWFCPHDGSILDPFGGEQTKGIVAGVLGLKYRSCEIRPEQVSLNSEACKDYPNVQYHCGDSNNIAQIITDRGFDLCFTSPPYYDLEVYSKDDMSALGTYEEFMAQYENIFRQCVDMLADGAFLVVKIGEILNKQTGAYRNFVGDNISMFMRLGLTYYNEIIMVETGASTALRASRYMDSRKVAKMHQNILVFYKGNIKDIKKKYTRVEFNEEDSQFFDKEFSADEATED